MSDSLRGQLNFADELNEGLILIASTLSASVKV